jgi:pantoate--beta-alanine ligase
VQPNTLFLGQKDYQQCMVIKKLIELTHKKIDLVIGQTLREATGLAMSSRNMRLSNEDKENATAIYKSLLHIQNNLSVGGLEKLQQQAKDNLLKAGFSKIDYVAICNANTLQAVQYWDGKEKLVALVAAFLNGVRLIDNMVLH